MPMPADLLDEYKRQFEYMDKVSFSPLNYFRDLEQYEKSDYLQDNSGSLSKSELTDLLAELGHDRTQAEQKLALMDTDQDGKVRFQILI